MDFYHTSTVDTWCGPSVNLECMSEMCCMRLAGNAGPKKAPKIGHLGTIVQLCQAISSQLRHISTIRKKLVKQQQQYLSHMSSQYGEVRPTSGSDLLVSLGHPCKFQRVSCFGSVTVRHSSSGRQSNFAAFNRGRHLYSAGQLRCWALAHVSSFGYFCLVHNLLACIFCSLSSTQQTSTSTRLPVPVVQVPVQVPVPVHRTEVQVAVPVPVPVVQVPVQVPVPVPVVQVPVQVAVPVPVPVVQVPVQVPVPVPVVQVPVQVPVFQVPVQVLVPVHRTEVQVPVPVPVVQVPVQVPVPVPVVQVPVQVAVPVLCRLLWLPCGTGQAITGIFLPFGL